MPNCTAIGTFFERAETKLLRELTCFFGEGGR
jgi:hypothetical protein